jgi:hypothetical protein
MYLNFKMWMRMSQLISDLIALLLFSYLKKDQFFMSHYPLTSNRFLELLTQLIESLNRAVISFVKFLVLDFLE